MAVESPALADERKITWCGTMRLSDRGGRGAWPSGQVGRCIAAARSLSRRAWGRAARPTLLLQRHPQTRDPARRHLLARRAHLPPRDLPLGHPLQHPPTPLLVPPAGPQHLRTADRDYSPASRLTNHTACPRSGVRAPGGEMFALCRPGRTMSDRVIAETADELGPVPVEGRFWR